MPLHVPDYVTVTRGDRVLCLDPAGPNWLVLDAAGAETLELCDGAETEAVIAALATRWQLSVRSTRRRVQPFLARLREADFVRNATADITVPPPYPGRGRAVAPDRLAELWIYVNRRCNLACAHCFVGDMSPTNPQLSTDALRAVIDEAHALGADRFYFTGGEPFLRKDMPSLLGHVTQTLGADAVVLTNATTLTSGVIAKLEPVFGEKLAFQISLEAPDAAGNDAIRGDGAFARATEGLQRLIDAKQQPVVSTVLTGANAARITEMPAFLAALGVRHFHVHWLYTEGRSRAGDGALPPAEVANVMRALRAACEAHRVVLDNVESLRARVLSRRGRKSDLCNACYESLSVDANGDVYVCAPATGSADFRLGSLRDDDLETIWRTSRRAAEIRRCSVTSFSACTECAVRFLCGGGCLYRAHLAARGDDPPERDDLCEVYRALIDDIVWREADPAPDRGHGPRILAQMQPTAPRCETRTRTTDLDWEVGTAHCTCFLAADGEDEALLPSHKSAFACFGDAAPQYDQWAQTPLGRAFGDAVARVVGGAGGTGIRVLEVGCGTGNHLLPLAAAGARATGVDASDAMLRVAHHKAKAAELELCLEHARAESLPFADGAFDFVCSFNALEFVDDRAAAVAEMVRVLRPGGRLAIAVLNRRSVWGATQRLGRLFAGPDNAYYRGRFFTRNELRTLVGGALGHDEIALDSTVGFPPLNFGPALELWTRWPATAGSLPDAVLIAQAIKAEARPSLGAPR